MNHNISVTVFTPTYNRENTLPVLFESLMNQSCVDFEWLIVNDGSTDNTIELVDTFIKQAYFPIRMVNTENGGKHRAINKGMKLAHGEWFAIVDSDDFLLPNAIERIIFNFKKIINHCEIVALCFLIKNKDGNIVGDQFDEADNMDTFIKFFDSKIRGDKFLVLNTNLLKEIPFPEFLNENFIAESAVWLRLGNLYQTEFINEALYVCEYLSSGLSHNSLINRIKCPNGAIYVYKLKYELCMSFTNKLNSGINWWRFYFHGKFRGQHILVNKPDTLGFGYIVPGFFIMLSDLLKVRRKNI